MRSRGEDSSLSRALRGVREPESFAIACVNFRPKLRLRFSTGFPVGLASCASAAALDEEPGAVSQRLCRTRRDGLLAGASNPASSTSGIVRISRELRLSPRTGCWTLDVEPGGDPAARSVSGRHAGLRLPLPHEHEAQPPQPPQLGAAADGLAVSMLAASTATMRGDAEEFAPSPGDLIPCGARRCEWGVVACSTVSACLSQGGMSLSDKPLSPGTGVGSAFDVGS